eukprot:scaffold693_cov200-Alexandrium_tamarense.AAC.40
MECRKSDTATKYRCIGDAIDWEGVVDAVDSDNELRLHRWGWFGVDKPRDWQRRPSPSWYSPAISYHFREFSRFQRSRNFAFPRQGVWLTPKIAHSSIVTCRFSSSTLSLSTL